jgi:uncharacterized protein (DUF302 family)
MSPTASLAALLLAVAAPADTGLVEVTSAHDVPTTVSRLEAALQARGIPVVARVDHAAAAAAVGESLPPTVLLLFGNPKLGAPLMRCAPTAGIDLPMKALVRDDGRGRVTLSYVAPAWLVRRHGGRDCGEVAGKMAGALAWLAAQATAP